VHAHLASKDAVVVYTPDDLHHPMTMAALPHQPSQTFPLLMLYYPMLKSTDGIHLPHLTRILSVIASEL
jgi:hypothetical protein